MEEIVLSEQSKTLVAKYAPIMEDRNVEDLSLHPDQLDDPDSGVMMLAASMEEFGQGRPIICVPGSDGKLQIIEGSRIWKGGMYLGWNSLTTLNLTAIRKDEILPLMYALKSHNKEISYALIAKRFATVKAYAKEMKEKGDKKFDGAEMTTREYLKKVFGFTNEHYVSDFETILKSPERDEIIKNMDAGHWNMSKATKKAQGKVKEPKPDEKSYKDEQNVFACQDCPRRKAFLDRLNTD